MRKTRRQGHLHLVLLGSVTALAACQPSYSTRPEEIRRAGYTQKNDCTADWGADGCEEVRTSGGTSYYSGPYYSSAGRVYGYDGVTRSLSQMPQRSDPALSQRQFTSEAQLYAKGTGRYAPVAAQISRGGFGGGGRGMLSGGG